MTDYEKLISETVAMMKRKKANDYQYLVKNSEWQGVLSLMLSMDAKLTAIKEALMTDEEINNAVGYEDSEIVGYVGGARDQRNRIQKFLMNK